MDFGLARPSDAGVSAALDPGQVRARQGLGPTLEYLDRIESTTWIASGPHRIAVVGNEPGGPEPPVT